jgi:hypothetical protein
MTTKALTRKTLKSPRRQRGGAYTFTILGASAFLLAMGGSFMAPAKHTLTMNNMRYHKLVVQNLVEGGLDWALAQKLDDPKQTAFELATGHVEVRITPKENNITIIDCFGWATKSRLRQNSKYHLKATVLVKNGKANVIEITTALVTVKDKK